VPVTSGLRGAIEATVEDGEARLKRSWLMLLATGAVGGIDVGIGVFALLLVLRATHSDLLSGLAFSIGFVALTLANSELFTENFLVPLAAVAAGRAKPISIVRLWAGTWAMNLVGGWVITLVVMRALPFLNPAAVKVGTHFARMGINWTSFCGGILAGTVITLMTWMEVGSESAAGRLVAAVACGFLLAAAGLNHAIVLSLDMFAALHAGAPFGYWDWFTNMLFAALANAVGGIGLVAMLRIAQQKAHQWGDQSTGSRNGG
jgi:formate-nitrite transporter family protein